MIEQRLGKPFGKVVTITLLVLLILAIASVCLNVILSPFFKPATAKPLAAPTPRVYSILVPVGPDWAAAEATCARQHGGRATGIYWSAWEPRGRQVDCADGKTWSVEDGQATDVTVTQ
jgi:hypothetical protein